MFRIHALCLGLAFGAVLCSPSLAAADDDRISGESVIGYWTGAIVKDGTPLVVNTHISAGEGGLVAKIEIPEWLWYDLPPAPVSMAEHGIAISDFFRGDARFVFDPRYRQLVGEGEGYRVHLKRALPPPTPRLDERSMAFASADGTRIAGTLILPEGEGPHAAVIIVRGRGCAERAIPLAALFARYGVAAYTYDRRGAGRSEGDCAAHSFEALVDDVGAAVTRLAEEPGIDPDRIGLQGTSLGAWVAQGVVGRHQAGALGVKPAFLATWIGPATSILDQQIASAFALAESEDLPDGAGALAAEAARIAADRGLPADAAFARLATIRSQAEAEGWLDAMFAPDDLPAVAEEVPDLFLRRFRFDPAPVLSGMTDTPVLAVLGEDDPIVPLAANRAAYEAVAAAGGDLTVVVVSALGHALEHGDVRVALPDGGSYFKIDTVEPAFMIASIDFLRRQGFAPE